MELDEKVRRRLETSVRLVEQRLLRIERLLAEGVASEAFRRVEDNSAAGDRARLLQTTREFREALVRFGERFGLRPQQVGLTRLLEAELSSMWVILENCYPKRMKGYNVEWTPELRRELEAEIANLLGWVRTLRTRMP